MQINHVEGAIEKLYALNVGVIGQGIERHERPHKPVLLLAVFDLIAADQAMPERISWSNEVRQRFSRYFSVVQRANDQDTPENPFFHLRGDKFWEPVEIVAGVEHPLGAPPTAAQAKADNVFARFVGGFENIVANPEDRMKLREALISRFFPAARAAITPLFENIEVHGEKVQEDAGVEDADPDEATPGRDPAFRRLVLEVYDYQCAACGLRIKLPDADLTFVDGAHIIPFNESRNDHPTNGLALCKNHHWAMDRFLIVPTPKGIWKASPRLNARRSPGEADLIRLDNEPLLPPHDEAFAPDPVSLAWRSERLYAQ